MTWTQGVAPRTATIIINYNFPTAFGLDIQKRCPFYFTIMGLFRAPPTPQRREFPLYHTASNLSSKIFRKNAQILFPGIVHFDEPLQYAKVLKCTPPVDVHGWRTPTLRDTHGTVDAFLSTTHVHMLSTSGGRQSILFYRYNCINKILSV